MKPRKVVFTGTSEIVRTLCVPLFHKLEGLFCLPQTEFLTIIEREPSDNLRVGYMKHMATKCVTFRESIYVENGPVVSDKTQIQAFEAFPLEEISCGLTSGHVISIFGINSK